MGGGVQGDVGETVSRRLLSFRLLLRIRSRCDATLDNSSDLLRFFFRISQEHASAGRLGLVLRVGLPRTEGGVGYEGTERRLGVSVRGLAFFFMRLIVADPASLLPFCHRSPESESLEPTNDDHGH